MTSPERRSTFPLEPAPMSFTHQVHLGASYSLDTHIRIHPPFKVRVMKLKKRKPAASDACAEKAGRRSDAGPSAMKPESEPVVRQGAVRVKQRGIHPRNWFCKIRWLALSETHLALHPSQTKPRRCCILLADIDKLERTEHVPYGLTLQTKDGRRYLLIFENDSDLYEWKDDISLRYRSVGAPYNFVHERHGTFHPSTGAIAGLPEGWNRIFLDRFGSRDVQPKTSSNVEPSASLVIRVPKSNLEYGWRVHSSAEDIQDILESVCNKIGLRAGENMLTLAGENTPLAGSVADLKGKRELEIVPRTAAAPMVSRAPSGKGVFIRITLEASSSHPPTGTTFPVDQQTEIKEVLQIVCRKRKLEAPHYALRLADDVEPLPMDRTVADLEGKHHLVLFKRQGPAEILLRVNLRISPDEAYLGSVSANPETRISDVLHSICAKMKFTTSDYVLSLSGSVEPLAMENVVANLEGKHQLVLVRRASR
ncbi:hypothetical protein DFH06DRAFT_1201040 [Mycena polygramma]|nr:hypothetical protein DFH06DRAFT_1201040 [Mycena polygramma]